MINKLRLLIFAIFCMNFTIQSHSYLWEQMTESGASCCLHFDGVDICNPNNPCQYYIEGDLAGIFEYTSRLLSTERGAIEPYHTDLIQVSKYIRRSLNNPYYFISYKLDQHRSVQFYHELIDIALKSKDKGTSRTQAQKQSPKYDYAKQYLIKMGLFVPYEHKNGI